MRGDKHYMELMWRALQESLFSCRLRPKREQLMFGLLRGDSVGT